MDKEDVGKRIASKADLIADNEALRVELKRLKKELDEAIKTQRTNAWKIQQQAFRGMKYAQKENARLREALEFYAHGKHLLKASGVVCDAYDLVSGKVENGKYAQEVLKGCAK